MEGAIVRLSHGTEFDFVIALGTLDAEAPVARAHDRRIFRFLVAFFGLDFEFTLQNQQALFKFGNAIGIVAKWLGSPGRRGRDGGSEC